MNFSRISVIFQEFKEFAGIFRFLILGFWKK
jgi:hypothetical protein